MQNTTYNLYPELDTFIENTIKVDDLHEVYYEICGNPTGEPIVFLHGGPGSGCNPMQRRFFDPEHYYIVLIDQRGCGRSKPLGATTQNTTADLVADINLIRITLGISKWQVFGGSWGSTLALSYALAFPQHVTCLILRGIFLSRPTELNWFLGEVAHFYPEVWHTLQSYLPVNEQHDVLSGYRQRIFSEDSSVSIPSAIQWNAFENAIMRLTPNENKACTPYTHEQGEIEVARARVQIHYIQHNCFVDGSAILNAASRLAHIPTVIVQGRYDMVCPPKSAWELSQAMPHAEFYIIQEAGHSAMETGITSALVAATEKFKLLCSTE
ncbi:proline iminopeptidase [mine drainage metagenome]|uniref:prolyl aminopeptidase n=1 Tax=mine drainage metagenome TaxID=410659 RepID=A0A1J5S7U4_9ZZZZ